MTSEIPEGGWPEVPVLAPYETPEAPELVTGLVDMTDEAAVEEFLQFHKDRLIPQMVCNPTAEPWPTLAWTLSQDPPRQIVVCHADGQLEGGWIIKGGGIYYPVANHEFIAATLRALWDETIKHFDYVWASSESPMIMAFAAKAVRIPARYSTPTINGDRLEWRRP